MKPGSKKTFMIGSVEIAYKLPGRPDFVMIPSVRVQIEEQLTKHKLSAGTFRLDYCTGWWIIKNRQHESIE